MTNEGCALNSAETIAGGWAYETGPLGITAVAGGPFGICRCAVGNQLSDGLFKARAPPYARLWAQMARHRPRLESVHVAVTRAERVAWAAVVDTPPYFLSSFGRRRPPGRAPDSHCCCNVADQA